MTWAKAEDAGRWLPHRLLRCVSVVRVGSSKLMSSVTESVDVNVPIPYRLRPVDPIRIVPPLHVRSTEIRQTDDVHTHWILEIAGQVREFDATITEQHSRRTHRLEIGCRPNHAGVITLPPLGRHPHTSDSTNGHRPGRLRRKRRRQTRSPHPQNQKGHGKLQGVHRIRDDHETGAWRGTSNVRTRRVPTKPELPATSTPGNCRCRRRRRLPGNDHSSAARFHPAVLRLLESHPCVLKCMPGAGTLRACAQAAAAAH